MASIHSSGSPASDPRPGSRRSPSSPLNASPFALQRLVEGEIIPRLLLAHRAPVTSADVAPAPRPVDGDIAERFAITALHSEAYGLLVEVEALLSRGVTVESIFLEVLAPAAAHLGVLWERDACDFVDVTMALWRLQEIVHELAARMPGAAERRGGERRALFAPLPGEQHGFGSLLVEEFFRRAGWTTLSEPGADVDELVDLVSTRWFEMVGLTVSLEANIDRVPGLIATLRTNSRNPRIGVMVGGRVFVDHPDWAARCGADATAADARQAVMVAETLLDVLALRADSPISGHG
jgi:methanogenic corrinoid protein MtbC1